MEIIDGYSHMYQTFAPLGQLKRRISDIEGFDISRLLQRMDEMGVSRMQTMPQEMARIQAQWLGSNALSADIQRSAPAWVVGCCWPGTSAWRGNMGSSTVSSTARTTSARI